MDTAPQPLGPRGDVALLARRPESERRRQALVVAAMTAAALCAVALGALAAYSPVLALGAVIGAGYVGLVFRNLPLALALWVPLIFFEGLSGFSKIPEAAALLLALGWVAVLARSRTASLPGGRVPPMVLVPLAGLALWLTASLIWAQEPDESLSALVRIYAVVLLFIILVNQITSRRVLIWVLAAFVFGAILSVVFGLATGLNADA